MVDQVILSKVTDDGGILENFQNLFTSILKNDAKKKESSHKILQQEDKKERQAFDAMKVALQQTHNRNVYKKMHLYRKMNDEIVGANKRETHDYNRGNNSNMSQDLAVLEKLFLKLHPHEKVIVWKDIGNLNPRTHKQLCDDVLKDILPPDRDYNGFSYIIDHHEHLHEEKVTMLAPLVLQNETVHVTVVLCEYEEIKFYITRADDNHMFTLVRERETGIFHFKAGLHPVQPNYTIAMTFDIPVETTTEVTGDI